MNEKQEELTVQAINRCVDDADKADRKAFWELFGLNACILLIGVASYLSNHGIISADLATGAQVVTGMGGAAFLTEAISNNTKRINLGKRASELQYGLEMSKFEDEVTGKHVKSR